MSHHVGGTFYSRSQEESNSLRNTQKGVLCGYSYSAATPLPRLPRLRRLLHYYWLSGKKWPRKEAQLFISSELIHFVAVVLMLVWNTPTLE